MKLHDAKVEIVDIIKSVNWTNVACDLLKYKYLVIWTVILIGTVVPIMGLVSTIDFTDKIDRIFGFVLLTLVVIETGIWFTLFQPHWIRIVNSWKTEE